MHLAADRHGDNEPETGHENKSAARGGRGCIPSRHQQRLRQRHRQRLGTLERKQHWCATSTPHLLSVLEVVESGGGVNRERQALVLREGGAGEEVGGGCGVVLGAYVHARDGQGLGDDGSAHRCSFRFIGQDK